MTASTQAAHPRKFLIATILFCFLFTLLTMACILWDLAGQQVSQEVYSLTYTAIAYELTELVYQSTDDAYWTSLSLTSAAQTEQARQEAEQGNLKPHGPPVITWVYFPAFIPGNGTTYNGELSFRDEMGDVNRITIEVVKAENFGGADYDPRPYLIRGDQFEGTYQLYIWCEGAQEVSLSITLYDSFGSKSNSVPLDFTCQ